MKNIGHYFLIALGGASAILSIYELLDTENYLTPICGIIVGLGLIKTSLDKMKLKKELVKK
ncbi:hypothetical protein LX97_00420 [Nonlabens dokdonensis]|jgi:hypothetical protein|uniref:Uncharacterized protein n=2 Tax=Nonlabens dokdonensis TaxID=328515 RepID=L7W2L0_NONDD|nr:hypothetical protein [Nonlabens dokdonensis]AGC75735.1 hypothetical protein DDD_0608 [Nonlabens dokdonensis DSW-6]PZX43420.1 hypothetical protein LX97_00420 [Nonlabens dokdonensis]